MQQSDELVKEIKAKLQEQMLCDEDTLMQITPSFTHHVLSMDAGFIESCKPMIIDGTQIQSFTSAIYSEVGVCVLFFGI